MPRRLEVCGSEDQAAFPKVQGDCFQCFDCCGDHPREGHDGEGENGGEEGHAKSQRLHEDSQSKEPVHDGRDAREIANGKLHSPFPERVWPVFCQEDCCCQTEGEAHGDHADAEREGTKNGRKNAPPRDVHVLPISSEEVEIHYADTGKNEQEQNSGKYGDSEQSTHATATNGKPFVKSLVESHRVLRWMRKSATKFTRNVRRKRMRPRAKRLCQCVLPMMVSLISMAIVAVMGRAGEKRDRGGARLLPATMRTIMVSPMIRPSPSMIAAAIPWCAAGSTTRRMVAQRVAPRARLASL